MAFAVSAINSVKYFLTQVITVGTRHGRGVERVDILLHSVSTKPSIAIKPFRTFAEGLLDDYAAVKASMMLKVSNGPVEGLNNRLKLLKRQMYGRAGLELLKRRFLLAS